MLKAGRPSRAARASATLSALGEEKAQHRINFDIPVEEYDQLKIYAARHRLSIREIFRQHIASLLSARS